MHMAQLPYLAQKASDGGPDDSRAQVRQLAEGSNKTVEVKAT